LHYLFVTQTYKSSNFQEDLDLVFETHFE
jgi:hypothetical protein